LILQVLVLEPTDFPLRVLSGLPMNEAALVVDLALSVITARATLFPELVEAVASVPSTALLSVSGT